MTFKWLHIALIIGMVLVIGSFIFFGLNTNTYVSILFVGIIISAVAFCKVMFGKDSARSKLLWLLMVIIGIIAQWLSEPILIRLSYVILVKQNEVVFSKVNAILLSKNGEATWVQDSSLWKRNNIFHEEGSRIRRLLRNSRVTHVQKDSSRIFYMTFSRIDIIHGISFYYLSDSPKNGTHLFGNWYY